MEKAPFTPVLGEEPIAPNLFDIILPVHNRLELTIKSLTAMYACTTNPFHLIIVDDSTDLTPTFIHQFINEHDNVTYIHSDKPYKEGNQILNIGLERVRSEFVASITSSITVEPQWEVLALDFLRKNSEVGILGLKQLLPWGAIESAGIRFVEFMPIDIGRNQPSSRFTSFYECEAVAWALAIVRKKAVYPLPESVYHGFRGMDDIDNCFVAKKKGWKVFYCGYGVGYHETRATRGSDAEGDIQANLRNREIFAKRWGFLDKYKKVLRQKKATRRL